MAAPVVHLLEYGQALCYFAGGDCPGDWPEGHRWVGHGERALANCVDCLAFNGQNEDQAWERALCEARERPGRWTRREASGMHWYEVLHLAGVQMVLSPRPLWCPRGRLVVVAAPTGPVHFELARQVQRWGFPRYYFDLYRCKEEIAAWCAARDALPVP